MVAMIWLVLGFTLFVLAAVFGCWALNSAWDYLFGARHVAHHRETFPAEPKIRSFEEMFPNHR